jgi:hypothetical protein
MQKHLFFSCLKCYHCSFSFHQSSLEVLSLATSLLAFQVCATPATQALIAAVQSLQSGCSSVPYTKGSAMGIAHHISNIVLQS